MPPDTCIYTRLSHSPDGSTEKVERQEADARKMARTHGWVIGLVYTDNNLSAWRRDVKRPGWEQMLADIVTGRWRRIIVWHGDRLIRQPWDLELLLRLADERRLELASVAGIRDLSSEDDRFVLRIEAAVACRESASISRRSTRGKLAVAEAGKPRPTGGLRRRWGYEPDGVTLVAGEKAELESVVGRLLDGESINSVVKDLTARHVPTSGGGQWRVSTLRSMLRSPYLAGKSTYRGQVIADGQWPALLDPDTWEAVNAVLDTLPDPAGRRGKPSRGKLTYLLSGIAACGSCDGPLYGHHIHTRPVYLCRSRGERVCPGPRVCRSMPAIDEYVISAVLARLGEHDIAPAAGVDELRSVKVELVAVRGRIKEIEAELRRPQATSVARLTSALGALETEEEALRKRVADAGPRPSHTAAGLDRAAWDALGLDRRRAIIRDLYDIALLPVGQGKRTPPGPESVRMARR